MSCRGAAIVTTAWLCDVCVAVGDTELESVWRVTGNIVSNQVSILLRPDDNNAEYQCNASNDATTDPLVTSVNLRVSCTLMSNCLCVGLAMFVSVTTQHVTLSPSTFIAEAGDKFSVLMCVKKPLVSKSLKYVLS